MNICLCNRCLDKGCKSPKSFTQSYISVVWKCCVVVGAEMTQTADVIQHKHAMRTSRESFTSKPILLAVTKAQTGSWGSRESPASSSDGLWTMEGTPCSRHRIHAEHQRLWCQESVSVLLRFGSTNTSLDKASAFAASACEDKGLGQRMHAYSKGLKDSTNM